LPHLKIELDLREQAKLSSRLDLLLNHKHASKVIILGSDEV